MIDRFEDLFNLLSAMDFPTMFEQFRTLPAYTPFEILPQDMVIRKGTGEYWRNFPSAKTKLK